MRINKPYRLAMPNHVGPEHHALPGDVSPQDIESLVPVIELLIIRRLKARSA